MKSSDNLRFSFSYIKRCSICFCNSANKIDNKYFLINNSEDLNKLITLIKKTGYFSIDTETNSLNIEEANLIGVSIAVNENSAYYIPINHKNLEDNKRLNKQIKETELIKLLQPICNDPSILKIGHNIKYDLRVFQKYNIIVYHPEIMRTYPSL